MKTKASEPDDESQDICPATVDIDHRGENGISRRFVVQGKPDVGAPVVK